MSISGATSKWCGGLVVVLLTSMLSSTGRASPPSSPTLSSTREESPPRFLSVDERIKLGKLAIDNLEYEHAAEELTIAAISSNATLEQRIEANLYAGIAHRILGRDVDAKLNFVFVLKHKPEAELPGAMTPKIRNFFELIRQEVELSTFRSPPNRSKSESEIEPSEPKAPNGATTKTTPTDENEDAKLPSRQPTKGTIPVLAWVGGVALSVGVLGVALGGAGALGGEVLLGDPAVDGSLKEAASVGFLISTGLIAAGVATAVVGAGLFAVGALE